MEKTIAERMAELPTEECLGVYTAKTERLRAELRLKARITRLAVIDSGTDWYEADVKFFTEPIYRGEQEGFSVAAHYSSNRLGEIITRMKRAESGFEEVLMPPTDHNYRWQERREVLRCIFSLEEQTRHLYAEREQAQRKRNVIVYGKENPREGLD